MGKLVKLFILITTILLFFTTCDTPLKEFIENATGRAVVEDEWEITPNRYTMLNGIIAISPSDEAEYTYLTSDIDNPQKGSIKLEMEGKGSEHATAELNDKGQAVIKIVNQERLYEFDLTMNIYVNGRRMGEPKKIPKMQSRYFNTGFQSLEVIDPELEKPLLYSSNLNVKNHDVDLPEGVKIIEIYVTLFENVYSACTIGNGSSNLFDISSGQEIIPITVTADCGIKKPYNLTASLFGFKDAVAKVVIDGVSEYYGNLDEAFVYIAGIASASEDKAVITVLKNIEKEEVDDKFILTHNGFIQNIHIGCDEDVTLLISNKGSLFTIGDGIGDQINFYVGNPALYQGTLTLNGINDNDSPLINVNGGKLYLYENAIIKGNINESITEYGGGVAVKNNGEFHMNGGKIEGNYASNGGGVAVLNSSFYMYDNVCYIYGNEADNNGGGVYLGNPSTFEMNGGTIGGNYDKRESPNRAKYGGGVYISGGGAFEFKGGLIGSKINAGTSNWNNQANVAENGGGVYLATGGTFNFYTSVPFTPGNSQIMWNYAENVDSRGGVYITPDDKIYNGPPELNPSDANYQYSYFNENYYSGNYPENL